MVVEAKVVSTEPVVVRSPVRYALPAGPQPLELATFIVGVAGVAPTSLLTALLVMYAMQGSGLWWGAVATLLTVYFGTMATLWAITADSPER